MQNTTNFNFNLPEGTDLWNYLTQTNPNFTALDSILKSVQDGTVTTATEVTSGTAHAVTRTLPDANVIRFTATGVWTLGDTMTIDGTPVTVVKPNGTSLQTGDYIIGTEVLGILRATQFTVYVGGASSMDAEDVDYDNTLSGLTATDVQVAIDEEAAAIDTIKSNLAVQDITSQITISNGTIKVYKTGKVVMVSWDIGNFTIPNGDSTIATNLPLPCTPASSVGGSSPVGVFWNAGGNGQILPSVVFTVDSIGNLTVFNMSGAPISGSYKGTHLMYICR